MIEDIGKFVDGVIRFYAPYPEEAIKAFWRKHRVEVEKMVVYSPVVNVPYTITPYIEHEHLLTALRRFLNKEFLNIN